MTRSEHRTKAARRIAPGALRRSGAGDQLDCLLLAPFPDWVGIDLSTGALIRAEPTAVPASPEAHGDPARKDDCGAVEGALPSMSGPLACLSVTIGESSGSWDPSRPEAVVIDSVEEAPSPSRRSMRKLLSSATVGPDQPGLLGTVGPSLPYAELLGTRPSVQVVSPTNGRAFFVGEELDGAVHFRLGARDHVLPVVPATVGWVHGIGMGARRSRRSSAGPSVRSQGRSSGGVPSRSSRLAMRAFERPVLLTIGLDLPRNGQVRKVILGVVPAP